MNKLLALLFACFIFSFVGTSTKAQIGINCPAGFICVQPTDTISDETNVQKALNAAAAIVSGNGRPTVLLLPGVFDICSPMTWPNGVNIRGTSWQNDDSISFSINANFSQTRITCNDGSFSRFSNGSAFFVSTNSQNQTMENLQFYGIAAHSLSSPTVNCVNSVGTAGSSQPDGGKTFAHNSFMGCYEGINFFSNPNLSQDSLVAFNFFYSNVGPGIECNACSDLQIENNHFGDNGVADVNYDNGGGGHVIGNRFEFGSGGIVMNGGTGVLISNNYMDKMSRCLELFASAANHISDIAFVSNRCNLGNSTTNSAIGFFDAGGSTSALKLYGITIKGNAFSSDSAGGTGYYMDNTLGALGITIDDQTTQPTFYNATSMRALWPFVTWLTDQFMPNLTNTNTALPLASNTLNLTSTVNAGIASETFATGYGTQSEADQITEDTSNGAHSISSISGTFSGGQFGTGQQFTFQAIIKAGSTARDFGFIWSDRTTNTIGEIWNPSSCTVVGTYGTAGAGALVGAATANQLNNGFCFIKATLTLGTTTSISNPLNRVELCSAAGCAAYTGTTGSVLLQNPTFKPCLAASGTAC